MADRHVLNVSPKTVQWGVWDARLEPVLRVKSGDLVEIHTISASPRICRRVTSASRRSSSRCMRADPGRARIS